MGKNHADFSGDKNPFRQLLLSNPEERIKASERSKAAWAAMTEEEREERNRKQSLAIANSDYHKNFSALKCHKKGHIQTKKGGKIFHRSSWEKTFALFLDKCDIVISFRCEPFCIEYQDGEKRRYTRPDFLVETKNETWLIEIKPTALLTHRNNPQKIEAMEHYAKNHNMIFELVTEGHIENLKEVETVTKKL